MADLPAAASGKTALEVARQAAGAASEIMLAARRSPIAKTAKGRGDFLTEFDVASEKATLALLAVRREQVAAAAGLNNLVRQLGGSLGIAVFASLVGRFTTQNRAAMVHNFMLGDSVLRQRLANVTAYFVSRGADGYVSSMQAIRRLDGRFQQQAYVIAFERAFGWTFVLFLSLLPLLLLLPNAVNVKAAATGTKRG